MNYDFKIDDLKIDKMVKYYNNYREVNNDKRILYSFKSDDFKIIIYNTKKVLFQGKKNFEEYEKWAKVFGIETIKPIDESTYINQYSNQRIIGSDEVGTGDFFGPIVVCSAYITPKDIERLEELNIRDSKTLTDKMILEIGEQLIDTVSYHVLVLHNERYNKLVYEGYNMNKIKAFLHNHAIKKMVDKHKDYQNVILDQFCTPINYFGYLKDETKVFKNIKFHTKGESVHKAVAVASIIARYKFLLEMDELSKKINITLPKGAGAPVDAVGKVIYMKYGKDIFESIAKLNFKNLDKITK